MLHPLLTGRAERRYGSARSATRGEVARAGLFKKKPNSFFIGKFGRTPMYWPGAGGVLLTAGPRGGKLATILAYSILTGTLHSNLLILDLKGELAAISQDQTADWKFALWWNPAHLHGLLCHRVNPLDYLTIESRTLVSDTKVLCENLIPSSGAPQADYFEKRGRKYLEAIILTLVELHGILTFPLLYDAVSSVAGGGEDYLDLALAMSRCSYRVARSVEEEIATFRQDGSNGFQSIMGELMNAVAPLSDPLLMASVSPPFDFSMADLCRADQAAQVYLMPPAEFAEAWAPVIKAIFVAGMIYKSRAPQAPQQTWILDEIAQMGNFPLAVKMLTYGAGIGIRPILVYQSYAQMRMTGPGAETIIPASAACQITFAVRDIGTAEMVSKTLGSESYAYDDAGQQERARHARREAAYSLLTGEDPIKATMAMVHHAREAQRPSLQHRMLMTGDEVLGLGDDKAIIRVDGVAHPIFANRGPYWEDRSLAGRFHPNPYHPPVDRVRVKSLFGHKTLRVVEELVPEEFAHYPQYRGGFWSKVRE